MYRSMGAESPHPQHAPQAKVAAYRQSKAIAHRQKDLYCLGNVEEQCQPNPKGRHAPY